MKHRGSPMDCKLFLSQAHGTLNVSVMAIRLAAFELIREVFYVENVS